LERQPVNGDGVHCSASLSQCRQIARDEWEKATASGLEVNRTSHNVLDLRFDVGEVTHCLLLSFL